MLLDSFSLPIPAANVVVHHGKCRQNTIKYYNPGMFNILLTDGLIQSEDNLPIFRRNLFSEDIVFKNNLEFTNNSIYH